MTGSTAAAWSARLRPRAGARRRWLVLAELLAAAAICVVGFTVGAPVLQVAEAGWVVGALRLVGMDDVSSAIPGNILIFGPGGVTLNAEVTASCSSILSIVGLTALTVAVFRGRRQHALLGLLVSVLALLALNWVRLVASTLAGIWWGRPAMVLFHDWVGSLWNFMATFLGFLVLVAITLPASERAEQDANGRHTARRPSSWARPGLGYQLADDPDGVKRGSNRLTSLFFRYVLPRRVAAQLGRRREAARIDYRIGHLGPEERKAKVRQLAADGLGAHTASLLAVATYDTDVGVLDLLAREVASRQWEPVTTSRVMSLRLWARGWSQARGLAGWADGADASPDRPDGADAAGAVGSTGVPPSPPAPPPPSGLAPELPMTATPRPGAIRSFAVRPVRPDRPRSSAAPRPIHDPATAEDD